MPSKSNKFTTPVVGTRNKSSEIIYNLLMCKCTLRYQTYYWQNVLMWSTGRWPLTWNWKGFGQDVHKESAEEYNW